MTRSEHYLEAEIILEKCANDAHSWSVIKGLLATAQVHATLATSPGEWGIARGSR